jgi:hypothetical protein
LRTLGKAVDCIDANGGTVHIAPGTYHSANITISNKVLSFVGRAGFANDTVITSNRTGRVFWFKNASAFFSDLTITNSTTAASLGDIASYRTVCRDDPAIACPDLLGGAVWAELSVVRFTRCVLTQSKALCGGFIYMNNTIASFDSCSLVNNTGIKASTEILAVLMPTAGGAIFGSNSVVTATNCLFSSNEMAGSNGECVTLIASHVIGSTWWCSDSSLLSSLSFCHYCRCSGRCHQAAQFQDRYRPLYISQERCRIYIRNIEWGRTLFESKQGHHTADHVCAECSERQPSSERLCWWRHLRRWQPCTGSIRRVASAR